MTSSEGEKSPLSQWDERICDAAWNGDAAGVRELHLVGADVDCYNRNGNTPLHLAIEQEHFETVLALLDCGADIERRTELGDWTPLLHAVDIASDAAIQCNRRPDHRIIALLLVRGADPNQRASRGESALMLAKEYRNREAERMLRVAGAV
ncbi:MAG TPA: ankyrin repeat domain-containing protein [Tepidisphaeraceae bacterium]|jgi:ankyrin repeat protein|nr:ankyrin repeat domain-containing protein [Tepidisphaeraceae bacterium]